MRGNSGKRAQSARVAGTKKRKGFGSGQVENSLKGLAANGTEGGLAGSMDNSLGLYVFDGAYSIPPAAFPNLA